MKRPLSRRDFLRIAAAAGASAAASTPLHSTQTMSAQLIGKSEPSMPAVFWVTDGVEPGDLIMAVGGGLGGVHEARLWRLADGPSGQPGASHPAPPPDATALKTIQANDSSFKVLLPAAWKPGIYGIGASGDSAVVINRPQLWFIQPTCLVPGMEENEAAAGAEVQIVGRDFLLPDGSGAPTIAIRCAGGAWQTIHPTTMERYCLTAILPAGLLEGEYDLAVHNGSGGAQGWSSVLAFAIKRPEAWPEKTWNVREHGAMGDDVHDDSAAIRAVLSEAEENGGGIVYFPGGTYRLSGFIVIPPRVRLRGEHRDASVLKWPAAMATATSDFAPAAIYTSSQFLMEDLTIIARNFDTTLHDLTWENGAVHSDVAEAVNRYIKPWGQYRDVFIRRVRFEQWLDAGRPPITADLALDRKFYLTDQCFNFRIAACRNFEVSNCIFQGGSNQFMGLRNARVTGNSFSNTMNYCWTVLGGGAHRLVCTDNDIQASSSFGYGNIGLKYVYSARNITRNFVRGEREGMTLDISALPSTRSLDEYWGTPIAVGNEPGSVTLQFPPASAPANADGFRTGFVPGSLRGGTAAIRALQGGPGAGQTRRILDNTADTITLDEPWETPPDTSSRRMYIELQERRNQGNNAWVGTIETAQLQSLSARPQNPWVPDEFVGDVVLVLTGRGAGQYRAVLSNSENSVELDRPWDVMPEHGEAIGIWALTRHFVVQKCQGFDTSCFAQLWGSAYDYVVDGCHVERSQGVWGQMGWFVQIRNTESLFGMSFHPGIGPHGNTPEGNAPYALLGLNGGELRVTKFGSVQYPQFPHGAPIMVDKLLGKPIPGGLGTVLRRNRLAWNQRIVLGSAANLNAPVRFVDAVIDNNVIEHSEVGIQLGADVERIAAANNRCSDVRVPYVIARRDALLLVS